jgi:hypothetical protein
VLTLIGGAAVLAAAGAAHACSGPGAMARILANERLGWMLFAVTALVLGLGAGLLRRLGVPLRRVGLLAAPLLAHPGWWMSARSGDCGATLVLGSMAMTAVAGLVVAVAVIVALARRQRA